MAIIKFYKNLLRENMTWIKRAAVWAVVWFAIGGATFIIYPALAGRLVSFLETIFRDILGQGHPEISFQTAMDIFRNNLTAGVFALFFGVVLGIVPLFAVAFNFFIIGFLFTVFLLSKGTGTASLPGIVDFIASTVPHGILEIPAFIISCAFGLKLGFGWWKKVEGDTGGRLRRFGRVLLQNIQIIPLITILFFFAALLEVFVSGNITKLIVK